ncbi:heavy metal translocating P-type ATPase [Paracoccus sp. 1_MG-2023]|uniref:heavy metal translocating P-type ATPase n=1 Tax=unclassified Paracoccus (in: a-proteobacteria) TaxID=2688777 RepID=UPI001C08C40F|nr:MULTISPECIES: heavy metal translocating P-type ATPase [unclassified Paracoccus (in: a-proteobacteria)]MBU2956650.1 cadmium-translocating P-type ATPase [Paracoccus sp. C2R09]MDO6668756.1 heavy metal translocating P-type ATPase [Paracoccus sp. 1_MG-2023]
MTTDGMRREWRVTGMDCGSCAGKVRGAVERLPGVGDVDVTLMSERLTLTLDESRTTPGGIEDAVRALGFGIAQGGQQTTAQDDAATPRPEPAWYATPKGKLVIVTGALLAAAWAADLLLPEGMSHWAFVLATALGLAPIARKAFAMARARMPFTIEMLMTIAATGALFIGAAEEAALVVFLFAVGELLEGVAAGRARDGIRALSDLIPRTAMLEEGGGLQEVPAAGLRPGQVVLVRPGDRIPADGSIVEGISGVDESPVTGESQPVLKEPGAEVFAGSINAEAVLRVRVTKPASDNTIARIVKLVEEAESARAPTERFIDRFSRIYMPAITGLAVLVAVIPPLMFGQAWGEWTYRALALLLIGCPCALVISVPASIASALSAGARQGLLMKGGAVIENVAQVTHVAFDKTGTLTNGRPVVTDIQGEETDRLMSLAAAVERGASHPLGQAILARAEGLSIPQATDARAIPGMGATALVEGQPTTVGSPRLAEESGVLTPRMADDVARLQDEGKTVVILWQEQALGLIALRDEPREDARDALDHLQRMGVTPVMLTGDNQRTATAIASDLGIGFQAGLLPQDKVTAMRALSGKQKAMMVGDGINDAPALAAAHVGIAMGSGTDVALETAHGAILRNRVGDVAALIGLARAAMGNIRQNVAIALGLKGLFLITTIAGITGLWIAILADTGATVIVTANALRLLRFRA